MVLAFANVYLYADTKFQTDFVGSIESSIPYWLNIATHESLKIFTLLWCFETFIQIIFKNVLGNNMKQLPVYVITRVCFGGFFAACLLKPDFYLGVIQYFGSLSTPIKIQGHLITGFDAGWIFKQFKDWETLVYLPLQDTLTLNVSQSIANAIMYDIYMLCTCAIALMIIMLEVQIYMTVFGALVLTGFAGSSWTYGIWTRYMDTVIGLGIRVMVFGMLYGIITTLVLINNNTAPALTVVDSTISIILATACLWVIPNKIAGMVSGSAAGNSLAEAGAATLAGMALGKRMASKVPSFKGGGGGSNGGGSGGGGSKSTSSPKSAPASTKMPSSPPSPSGSGSGKDSSMPPMPPDWENDQPPPAPPPPNHMPPDWDG